MIKKLKNVVVCVLTKIADACNLNKQTNKQTNYAKNQKGGKCLFNLFPKELRGGCQLVTEVTL